MGDIISPLDFVVLRCMYNQNKPPPFTSLQPKGVRLVVPAVSFAIQNTPLVIVICFPPSSVETGSCHF